MSFAMKNRQKNYFENFPFYNVSIENPKIKHLPNTDLLHGLPYYYELSVAISTAFKGYA